MSKCLREIEKSHKNKFNFWDIKIYFWAEIAFHINSIFFFFNFPFLTFSFSQIASPVRKLRNKKYDGLIALVGSKAE